MASHSTLDRCLLNRFIKTYEKIQRNSYRIHIYDGKKQSKYRINKKIRKLEQSAKKIQLSLDKCKMPANVTHLTNGY